MKSKKKICFVLVAGFAPDNVPVLQLQKSLQERGFDAVASGFFGQKDVLDFQELTASGCAKNIAVLIKNAKRTHEQVIGIGISLGGAFLLECAKDNNDLDGIVSVGTPFRLKNLGLIKIGKILFPYFYPVWKRLQRIKKLRLLPLGAGIMMVDYLQQTFVSNLESVNTPVLFMHSKKDSVTDFGAVEEFSARLSAAKKKVVFFENGNHVIDNDPELIIVHSFDFFDLPNAHNERYLENSNFQISQDLAFVVEKHSDN